jgi:predicted SAM-dependent methyltransferase
VRAKLSRRIFRGIALGSGETPPAGWVGLDRHRVGRDIYPADIRDTLPVRSCTVRAVLAEHVLEHLFFDEIPGIIAEVRRILLPKGVFRVVSPDAQFIARLILHVDDSRLTEAVERDAILHQWPSDRDRVTATVNRLSHQWGQHRSLLTPDAVETMMTRAGFIDVVQLDPNKTSHLPEVPDVHPLRFPDDPVGMNFAVEGRTAV